MSAASFRFYEELNDFLPSARRGHDFNYDYARNATVKHAIEALGVPHTEVELILVNGQSVDFSHRLGEGDQISVYPTFESLNITSLLRVREKPLRRTRFIADVHLGALAKYLRMLGFDTLCRNDYGDDDIVRLAVSDGRIVLTRDRALLMRRDITHGCYVHARQPRRQLREVVERVDLAASARPFSRCMECNCPVETVARKSIIDRLPDDVRRRHESFTACRGCGRVYWEGSHFRRMQVLVNDLLRQDASRAAREI